MTKFLNISTDTSLGGSSPSDDVVSSQKAISTALSTKQDTLVSGTNIKTINGTTILGSGDVVISSSVNWGFIGGTLANQTDLKDALDAKANDNAVVHLAGDETITGQKTLSASPSVDDDSKKLATTEFVRDIVPAGVIVACAGSSAPNGWLICNGGAVSRTTYAALFAVIGTTYGAGDGSTTFNLPNFTNRVPMQSGLGYGNASDGSLPQITGTLYFGDRTPINGWNPSGCFSNYGTADRAYYSNDHTQTNKVAGVIFYASSSAYCYNRYGEDRVYPSHLKMNFLIKY